LPSRADFAQRYGAFLGFLQRSGRLRPDTETAAQVTLPNVEAYIADLTSRVRSVTIHNCIYKLRRAAELLLEGCRLLLARRDRERYRTCDAAPIEVRSIGLHGSACGSWTDFADRSAEFCAPPLRARSRHPERPHDRSSWGLPDPTEEFCRARDRDYFQGDSWAMVDRATKSRHQIAPMSR
jgi:hypothetical protein